MFHTDSFQLGLGKQQRIAPVPVHYTHVGDLDEAPYPTPDFGYLGSKPVNGRVLCVSLSIVTLPYKQR